MSGPERTPEAAEVRHAEVTPGDVTTPDNFDAYLLVDGAGLRTWVDATSAREPMAPPF